MFAEILAAVVGGGCLVLAFLIVKRLAEEVHWHKVNPEGEWF